MLKEDHKNTASYGGNAKAEAFRARQKELIDSGDFRAAHQMGIDDIVQKFGDKYKGAIQQLEDYNFDGSLKR